VVNWTHKDRNARLEIKVSAAYGSDPDKVRQVLLDCARAHTDVAQWPQPQALLVDFGGNALMFELRVFIDNVDHFNHVPSELRVAIDREFHAQGIEMPYPQTDVHLRDIDRIESLIGQLRAGPADQTR